MPSTLPLENEIQFLRNYIDLMKIRYPDNVYIRISLPTEIPHVQIPPLLFIPFVENAFKHGVSYRQKSYINFSLTIYPERIECVVENSKIPQENKDAQQCGIGLDNVKNRLQSLYPENHTLQIDDRPDSFHTLLIIPL